MSGEKTPDQTHKDSPPTYRPHACATFDLETARVVPAGANPVAHMPLGITIAACRLPSGEVRFWHGGSTDKPAPFMTRAECVSLVRDLQILTGDSTPLVSWNGAALHFLVLADESGLWSECVDLALHHVDVAFHFICSQGFTVSMGAVGRTLGLSKQATRREANAPATWRKEGFSRVQEYLEEDLTMLAAIYRAAVRDRGLSWITRQGTPRRWEAPAPLSVVQALRLQPRDTDWMRNAILRKQCVDWMVGRPRAAQPGRVAS